MKPIGDSLGDLHIHNDHKDDNIGMSDEDGDTHESEESEEDDREEQDEIANLELISDELKGSAFACSTSSPASVELVSAIRGSREKQGSTPRELRVSWAPDVYEPEPTKLQDIVTRGTKQKKVPKKKTAGKEGQKGKESSRGGSNKDSTRAGGGKDKKKKQNHRANGRGSKSFGYPDYGDADDF